MRASGYYWVKDGGFWVIAYWYERNSEWWTHGDDRDANDSDWQEIDERRIERGSEQKRDELLAEMALLLSMLRREPNTNAALMLVEDRLHASIAKAKAAQVGE